MAIRCQRRVGPTTGRVAEVGRSVGWQYNASVASASLQVEYRRSVGRRHTVRSVAGPLRFSELWRRQEAFEEALEAAASSSASSGDGSKLWRRQVRKAAVCTAIFPEWQCVRQCKIETSKSALRCKRCCQINSLISWAIGAKI